MEEKKAVQAEKRKMSRKQVLRRVGLFLCMAVMLAVPALATDGEGASSTGFNAIMNEWSHLTTLMNNVFNLMTSNSYFALFLAMSLLSAGIGVFLRVKRASRR